MERIPINNFMNTHYKYAIEVAHLVDLDNLENTIWPAGDRTFEDFYQLKKLPDQPLVERAPADDDTIYPPHRFQVSFEVSPDQVEVHVLPQFTMLELAASIGGLLFMGYAIGSLIFPRCAKFYLENERISMLYSNAVKPKQP